MPNLLAMSFEGELAPSFDLRCLRPGAELPDGWGLGYYPGGEPSASVLKEPAPPAGSIRSELVKAWESLESSLFLLHVRHATWGNLTNANTQPFLRTYGGRDWLFAHSGSLRYRLEVGPSERFLPVGSTDTELIFCRLMNLLATRGWRSVAESDPAFLRDWLHEVNAHGELSSVLTDGRDLVAYADRAGDGQLFLGQVLPPYEKLSFGDRTLEVDLTSRGAKSRKGVIITSDWVRATSEEEKGGHRITWRPIPPGHLVVVRQGAVMMEASPWQPAMPTIALAQVHLADGAEKSRLRPLHLRRPTRAEPRRFEVRHRTVYRYEKAVERSTHLLRLEPVHDHLQSLVSHTLDVSVEGKQRTYEDVFGNRSRRIVLETPFNELVVEARSVVEVLDVDPLSFKPLHARSTIPLVWMPWHRAMLQPFLLPPELPETELNELIEYAMSFVERNDADLLDTLLDINMSIFREYEYRQGSTTVFTTPFEVYANRRGVCQDFANLFICLARLLGVPARYACGYIYTGPKHENQVQSEASHAWVQVYLPEVGWKGFDPTNGILTQTDHVRVAVGRNYIDATPTSGTIFVGGGGESLTVDVRVEPI